MAASYNYGFQWSLECVTIVCGDCGIPFAVPKNFNDQKLKDKTNWHCPNGHQRHYVSQTEAEKLRLQLEAEKRETVRLMAARDDEMRRREHAERSAATYRGKVTAIKNRVGNGVCPCCNRTFQNLMRHMATKHPGFKRDE